MQGPMMMLNAIWHSFLSWRAVPVGGGSFGLVTTPVIFCGSEGAHNVSGGDVECLSCNVDVWERLTTRPVYVGLHHYCKGSNIHSVGLHVTQSARRICITSHSVGEDVEGTIC